MTIQIIEENKRPSFMQSVLGSLVDNALPAFQQYQKRNQYNQALQNLEGAYEDPEQRKLIQAYRELGQFPDVANKLGGQLADIGKQRQKSVADQLKGQQTAQSLQKIQQIYADPNLSEQEKVFGAYQELAGNPALANQVLNSLQHGQKRASDETAAEKFSMGYSAILEGDKTALKNVLDDPDTPLSVQNKLTNLWNKYETRQDVKAKELRYRQGLVQTSYGKAIADLKKQLEVYPNKAEETRLKKEIKRLEALQKADLSKLTKNPDAYTDLHLWGHVDPEFLPEEEAEEGFAGEELAFASPEERGEEQEDPATMERIEFLNSKFPPQEFSGKKKQDKSGRVYESDGRSWRLVQK